MFFYFFSRKLSMTSLRPGNFTYGPLVSMTPLWLVRIFKISAMTPSWRLRRLIFLPKTFNSSPSKWHFLKQRGSQKNPESGLKNYIDKVKIIQRPVFYQKGNKVYFDVIMMSYLQMTSFFRFLNTSNVLPSKHSFLISKLATSGLKAQTCGFFLSFSQNFLKHNEFVHCRVGGVSAALNLIPRTPLSLWPGQIHPGGHPSEKLVGNYSPRWLFTSPRWRNKLKTPVKISSI